MQPESVLEFFPCKKTKQNKTKKITMLTEYLVQYPADMLHLAAILLLLVKLLLPSTNSHQKSSLVNSFSLRSQLLYALVFVTRYVDLFEFNRMYWIVMKLFLISSSAIICCLLYYFSAKKQHEDSIVGTHYNHKLTLTNNQK